jgi:cytochrome c biogenesis protein CcmG/thiol:disulfide interchange protein DsbE
MAVEMAQGTIGMTRVLIWLPLALFLAFLGLFAIGLIKPDNHLVESRLVGKPLPAFTLPAGASDRPALASSDLASGNPRLLNIFASWCVPCAAEAPQLMALRRAGVEIDGIAIRDARPDVDRFLGRYGNPYARIGLDARSGVQMALGSSGVPETFVIDGRGHVAHQHIGDIRADDVADILRRVRGAR